MQQAFGFARDAQSLGDTTEKLKEVICELLKLTIELCTFVKEYTKSSFIGRTLKISSGPKINDYKERLLLLRNSMDSGIALHGALTTSRVSVKIDIMELQQRPKIV
ncbi:uncharacterized protein FOMMEDRAFT_144172 [Fomitiporia mediterranea MF3/22]|uniref:uncharacterized protein n=1 Tax=Fomitiporia mediterranea (strain MF3/22) TaxID=694068 RepID=UPI0004409726|nr:uncharacterized protein FOMMEDRAFT_144172 [Fomitiporia mediterranea MF3/22]EJD08074.1 hypothetical protein FOMMEDRAFT_144172 [Fomitiporia mediterranea MF3/22]